MCLLWTSALYADHTEAESESSEWCMKSINQEDQIRSVVIHFLIIASLAPDNANAGRNDRPPRGWMEMMWSPFVSL